MAGKYIEKINMQGAGRGRADYWETAAAVLAFVGGYSCFFSAIGMTAAWYALFFGMASAACINLFTKNRRGKLIVFGVCGAVSVVLAAVQPVPFAGSLIGAVNAVIKTANGNLYYGFPSVAVSVSSNAYSDFALCAVVSIWAGVLATVVQKNRTVNFSVTLGFFVLLLIFGLFPSPFAALLLVAALPLRCVAANGYSVKSAVAFLVLLAVLLAAAGASFAFSGSAAVEGMRRGVANAAERVLYGGDTLPQGRLNRAVNLYDNPDTVRLEVDLPGNVSNLYLKAFVGASFDGENWSETNKNDYVTKENQGLLDYVSAGGIPFAQYSRYSALLGSVSQYEITIKNLSANKKYAYAPYSLLESYGEYYDLNLRRGALASDTYGYRIFGNDASSERLIQADWVFNPSERTPEESEYLRYDAEYHRFVYNEYLLLGEGVKERIESVFSGADARSMSLFGVSRLIRIYYNEHFLNSEDADETGGDFLEEFFGGKIKKSNAVYFATAATLVFRAFGIPARYVEGYRVAQSGGGARHTVNVTGKDSHAWTEVYFDGVGWLPVDVTFYSESDLIDPTPGDTTPPGGDDNGDDYPEPEPDPDPEPEPPEEVDWVEENIPPENRTLFYALSALIPVFSVILILLAGTIVTIVRREMIFARKNRRLNEEGEAFGRAAMRVLDGDFASYGGYSEKRADALGVPEENTDRFIELVERAVYGGYDLNVNEREYVLRYIETASKAVAHSKGKLFTFYCKYLKCVGIGSAAE